jgi:hypothetical protein
VSASGGTRLLGLVKINGREILALVEQKKRTYYFQVAGDRCVHDCNIEGLSRDLIKVNHDGPAIGLDAVFSVSSSTSSFVPNQTDVEIQRKSSLISVVIVS